MCMHLAGEVVQQLLGHFRIVHTEVHGAGRPQIQPQIMDFACSNAECESYAQT